MKKFLGILLSISMLFTLTVPALAIGEVDDEITTASPISIREMFEVAVTTPKSRSTSPVTFNTTLANDTGDSYSVEMFEYLPASTVDGISHTKTFVYSTQQEYITPRGTNTETSSGWDDSISVYGSITVTYEKLSNSGGPVTYLLTNVSGSWDRDDSTVTTSNRRVVYTCQCVFALSQRTTKYPSTNTFDYDTGYTTYIPNDSTTSVLAANSYVELAHGSSSRWELTTEAMVFGNDIGDLI